ncbi:MAG: hypothetical protein RLN96_10050, partial [Pseudomonadales bacterium]
MSSKAPKFYPFFDPACDGETLSFASKSTIALAMGLLYALLHYFVLDDAMSYFEYNLWIMGVIISTSILALYIAVEVFRRNLEIFSELEGEQAISEYMINSWLSDNRFILSGVLFTLFVLGSSISFGIPTAIRPDSASLAVYVIGKLLAGFFSGMGLHGIVSVIVLYLKIAPELQYSLDLSRPDGINGIKKLGDSLWFFAGLVA